MRGGLHARFARCLELRPRLLVLFLLLLFVLLLEREFALTRVLIDEHRRRSLVYVGKEPLGIVRDLERLLPGLVRLEHLLTLVPVDGAAVGAEELARGLVETSSAVSSSSMRWPRRCCRMASDSGSTPLARTWRAPRGADRGMERIARGAETPRKADARRRRAAGAAGAAAAVASDMTGIGEEVEWIKARATRTRASTRRRVRGGGRSARFVRNARIWRRSLACSRTSRARVRVAAETEGTEGCGFLARSAEGTEIRAIRPKTCVARKSKTAHPVELTAEPRAHGEAKGREILLITWTTVTGDTPVSAVPTTRWRAPARARPRTRPRRAAPTRARDDSRETNHSTRARFPLGPDATRAAGRATARRAFLRAASERVFTRRAHILRGGGWPAPSRRRSPRASHPRARIRRADPAAASSGAFASRPRPAGLSHPSSGSSLDATRFPATRHVLSWATRLTPRASPPPALHTQPSRVQTIHRRREYPSRPRKRPSRPTAVPTRTHPPRATRRCATRPRHR